MAPAHLQGALFNICMAPVHLQGAHTSPCARQFIIPTRGSVCPPSFKELQFSSPTWRFQRNVACSHLATRDDQLPHQDRRRALCVPFGTTQVEFSFDMQVLLPALLPIDRAPARAHSTNPGHAHTRRRSTTRLRAHAGKTSRRRPAQAQRAAVTDSQERPPSEPCSRPAVTVANYMFLRLNYILRWLHFGFMSVS